MDGETGFNKQFILFVVSNNIQIALNTTKQQVPLKARSLVWTKTEKPLKMMNILFISP